MKRVTRIYTFYGLLCSGLIVLTFLFWVVIGYTSVLGDGEILPWYVSPLSSLIINTLGAYALSRMFYFYKNVKKYDFVVLYVLSYPVAYIVLKIIFNFPRI